MSKRYYTDYLGDDYEIDFEPSVDAAFITPYDIASTDITNRSDALWTPAEADGTAGTDEYPRIQCIIDIALTTGLPVDLCGKRWLVREELVADLTTSDHSLTIRNGELWFQTVYGGSSTSARLVGLTITGTQPSTKDPGPHPFPTLIDLKVGLVANPFILGVELVTTHGAHLQNVTFVKFNSEGSLVLKLNSCDTTRWFGGGFAEGTKPGGTGSQGNFQHAELDSCSDTALFGLKCASGGPDPFNASYIKAGYIGTTPGIHIIDCEQTTFIGCTIEEADDEALVEASVSSGTTRDICFVNCRFEHQDVETEWVKDKNTGELVEQPQTEYDPPPAVQPHLQCQCRECPILGLHLYLGRRCFLRHIILHFQQSGNSLWSGSCPRIRRQQLLHKRERCWSPLLADDVFCCSPVYRRQQHRLLSSHHEHQPRRHLLLTNKQPLIPLNIPAHPPQSASPVMAEATEISRNSYKSRTPSG